MEVRYVYAHENVKEDRKKIAFERGLVIFCFEEIDNGKDLLDFQVPENSYFQHDFQDNLLGGMTVIKGKMLDSRGEIRNVTGLPYYAWAHRGAGKMAVWFRKK